MDSEKMTLMKLWQRVEAMNYMDFALGGHNVSRPADVIQGTSPDRSRPQVCAKGQTQKQ